MIFYFIVVIVSLSLYRLDSLNSDSGVLITNMLVINLSLLFMIIGDKYNYSLNKILMLFSFFFFGIAPAIQYQTGTVIWSNTHTYTKENYYKLNLIIIFILITYQLLYHYFSKRKSNKIEQSILLNSNKSKENSNLKLIGISLISFLISLYVYNFKINELLIITGQTISLQRSTGLVYWNFIRPIPAISLFLYKSNSHKNRYVEMSLWMIFLLTNFPTSAPRFYIAALYIPIVIIYSKKARNNYLMLNKLIIIGLLIIFPFLDQARYVANLKELTLSLDFKMFTQGHFDSYQMFMHVVTENIITFGEQLKTAILFFVPRSIWEGKSVGSGTLVAEKYNFFFTNVSMNFFGEGYINFGYLGILFFIIIIAYINARYDKIFWEKLDKHSTLSVFYPLFLGLEFFLLRGDMLSGMAFIIGMFVSLSIINKLTFS